MKPRLLDLFCGAGGCSVGYARAGFEVVGVDNRPQPNYPFEFVQDDALAYMDWFCGDDPSPQADCCTGHSRFDAIHASPPCQAYTAYQRTGNVGEYPDLIAPVRDLLKATGLPYVIENVHGAPLLESVVLCGSQFDLDVQRHRLFETNWPLTAPWQPCRHKLWAPDRYPGGRSVARTGKSTGLVRGTVEIGSWDIPLETQMNAMRVDWKVTLEELSEMIPPAYTEFIGAPLLDHLRATAAA